MIRQKANRKHPWHVDMEHVEWEGLTVWIALKNVKKKECMSVISGSHLFNETPDDIKEKGIDLSKDAEVLKEAKRISPQSELIHLDVADGQFFIFHGRLWHSSMNMTQKKRYALIFQYCSPSQKVKVLDYNCLPKVRWQSLVPECLLVSGRDSYNLNKLINYAQIGNCKRQFLSIFLYLPRNVMMRGRSLLKL